MPPQVEIKKLASSELEISGEVPAEEFQKSWEEALKQIGEKARLDGFRPGKAPEKILIEKVGEGEILEKAAELCLKETWPKIVTENKIEALGPPEIVITKLARKNPLGFKIKTAILPEVKLADYKKIAGEVMSGPAEEITVAEKEIEGALEYLRKSRAKDPAALGAGGAPSELPELNDEFAKNLGSFENLEA
ncbi:MAG: trigger factor family protein, partial [bacterium]|nr:trigger factor family protein [bacterium]